MPALALAPPQQRKSETRAQRRVPRGPARAERPREATERRGFVCKEWLYRRADAGIESAKRILKDNIAPPWAKADTPAANVQSIVPKQRL